MRHLAAYLLAAINEQEIPSEAKIQNILGSVGVEADAKQLKLVIEKFEGKPPSKVIAEGKLLLGSMPAAGAASAAASATSAGPAAAAAPAKEEKKEEKKEEPEEESDDDMGFGLFD